MKPPIVELEDELGDVLEKAMRRAGLTPEAVAGRAGVSFVKIRDAVDYRSDLSGDELRRIATVLALNEVGFARSAAGGIRNLNSARCPSASCRSECRTASAWLTRIWSRSAVPRVRSCSIPELE